MARAPVALVIQWLCCGLALANDLDFTTVAARAGLPASRHRVTTADGYVLTLHRVGRRRGRPVLLMHGFLASGASWLDAGPAGLALRLAADCDLWVGNFRGTFAGRAHAALDPAAAAFWDYSLHELGHYDLPALVDHVLRRSGRARLAYVGHSQGGAAFLVMAATRPEYNARVQVFVGLAAASRLLHSRSAALALAPDMIAGFRSSRRQEIFDRGSLIARVTNQLCAASDRLSAAYSACAALIAFLDTYHEGSIARETMARVYRHFPAGVSLKLFSHFEQLSRSSAFVRFDHGPEGNWAAYGTAAAPRYNLTRVTAPTVLIHGLDDHLVTLKDSTWLRDQLPNVVNFTAVADPRWNHGDFVWSKDIPTMLYPLVRESLKIGNDFEP